MRKRVLKICGNTWNNASRDKRELSAYEELGDEVMVLAKGEPKDRGREENVEGFRVFRYTTRPLGLRVPDSINRFISLFLWARFARRLEPDLISGHDLLPGLTIAWLSTLLRRKKPVLIYDSHEFELGRSADRSRLKVWLISRWERFLMKRCAFSIMVNDCIADEVQKMYKLASRPIVVRSTPTFWSLNGDKCAERRHEFLSAFANKNVSFIAMHHGAILPIRGIEMIIKTVAQVDNVGLVILGNGKDEYLSSLHKLTEDLGVADRVLFHQAVPLKDLWEYVGAADVGMIAAPAKMKNALYSLPNKFFENIQSGTPIICPNYPAMKQLADKYELGLTCDPEKTEEMKACLLRMVSDAELYKKCRANVLKAKEDLCWEKEKTVLIEAYQKARGI